MYDVCKIYELIGIKRNIKIVQITFSCVTYV